MFRRTVLPEGPRVISARMPGARSVSVAAYVLAGSRVERPGEAGVAHFMEHITFKGTNRFPTSRAISEAIEGVGGSFNAATDRESTVYWVRVPRRVAARGVEVLGDLIVRPLLDEREIEQERTVIVEEIRSYFDDPTEYGQILFQQAMFGDGPLGREICGDEASIRGVPSRAIRDFWATTYRPANTVVSVAGDLEHEEAVELVAAAFGEGNGSSLGVDAAPALPAGERYLLAQRDTSQAQLVVGVPALRRDDPDAWVLSVLNGILGDGMSSRLFLSVREEKALAYDISSGVSDYSDAGALEIAAGVDADALGDALDAILAELSRLRDEPVPDEELAKAKAYLGGGLELRMDETRHVASWLGGQEALHDEVLTVEQALDRIGAVTSDDVARVARTLFRDDALRLAVVAPKGQGSDLDAHLRLREAVA
ncbi:MAG TPA: pitrilysin family protein [Candidatus Limnocylindrales bacterium]|nr:pitrilysin family protein [Candidatus Limnocylindrales bacterium]